MGCTMPFGPPGQRHTGRQPSGEGMPATAPVKSPPALQGFGPLMQLGSARGEPPAPAFARRPDGLHYEPVSRTAPT